jgi:hypothetical protein
MLMPIRYCTATSKRTKQPCRARAMRGVNVCYHHGGRSLRGFAHPNYRHGYYCKPRDLLLLVAFHAYRDAYRNAQHAGILEELAVTMPRQTRADYRRFMAAYRAAVADLPAVKLTPELAAYVMHQWRVRLRDDSGV